MPQRVRRSRCSPSSLFSSAVSAASGGFGGPVAITPDGRIASIARGPDEYGPRDLGFYDVETLGALSNEPLGCAIQTEHGDTFSIGVQDIVATTTGLAIADFRRICLVGTAIEAPTCQGR